MGRILKILLADVEALSLFCPVRVGINRINMLRGHRVIVEEGLGHGIDVLLCNFLD